MKKKIKQAMPTALSALLLFGFFFGCLFREPKEYSPSERRKLQQRPTLSVEAVSSTQYMSDFESYTLDQFPFREAFRSLKAFVSYYLLGQKDNNGIYQAEGYLSKIEYPLRENSVISAAEKLNQIREKYLDPAGCRCYYAVVPDKNYFLAENNGVLSIDYQKLISLYREHVDGMTYIDIWDSLTIEDYYRTDTHWKQENLTGVSQALANAMGVSLKAEYEQREYGPFYGVWYGQYALRSQPDTITYLTNEILSDAVVYNHETGKETGVYDLEKAQKGDGYDLFLSGASALLTINNPHSSSGKRLVIFRDSFGSSIAPLLLEGYDEIVLVDLRYVTTDYLGTLLAFDRQDVLFLYSTLILNNSTTLK